MQIDRAIVHSWKQNLNMSRVIANLVPYSIPNELEKISFATLNSLHFLVLIAIVTPFYLSIQLPILIDVNSRQAACST